MSKVYICPKCNTKFEEKEAKRIMLLCRNCGIKLKEFKNKEYIIEFDNFTISFSLPVKIGRNHQNELNSNPYISREHCEIIEENDIIYVIDSSTNGTFINSNKIKNKTSINIGDKIKLANLEGVFKEK
jgi:DNA-directed RNA polymerase subunit RPC12/RpoP